MAEAARQEQPKQTALARRQEQVGTVRTLLEKSKDQIAMALPKHLTPERLMRIAMTTIQKNPKLLEADPRSLIGAIIQCAQLGLEPDSVLGHAYLVPFWNNKLGRYDVTFVAGYKGLIALALRSGEVAHVHANNVFEGEPFNYEEGLTQIIKHTPMPPSKRTNKKIGTYAVAKLANGEGIGIWMWTEEIELIRDKALLSRRIDPRKAPRDEWGPWGTDEDEMFKKTAIRRISKILSLSPEFQKAAALDEMADAGIPQNLDQEVFLGPEGIVSAEMNAIAGKTAEKAEDLKAKIAAKNAEKGAAPVSGEPASADGEKQGASPDEKPAGDSKQGAGDAKPQGGAATGRRKARSAPQEPPAASGPPKVEDTETPDPGQGKPFPEPEQPLAKPGEIITDAKLLFEVNELVILLAHNKQWSKDMAFKTLLAAAGLYGKYTYEALEMRKIDNITDLHEIYKIGVESVKASVKPGEGGGLPFKSP